MTQKEFDVLLLKIEDIKSSVDLKIDSLKRDVDVKISTILSRMDKIEDQNVDNIEMKSRLDERLKSTQFELTDHKNIDKDTSKKLEVLTERFSNFNKSFEEYKKTEEFIGKDLNTRLSRLEKGSLRIILWVSLIIAALGGVVGISYKVLNYIK